MLDYLVVYFVADELTSYDLFELRGEEGGTEESRVELVKNRLISCQLYSTFLYSSYLLLNPNGPLMIFILIH